MGIAQTLYEQRYDFVVLGICIMLMVFLLVKYRKNLHIQKILAFGGFDIVSMYMLKTAWGIQLMEKTAKKYAEWVRLFGLVSIGIGFVGIVVNFGLLATMIFTLFTKPETQQVSLVLPFQQVPVLGYLSFTHWILAIFFLATIHEFAHGVVAKVHKIPVKTSGLAVLNVLRIPLIPAAFVEPDEKEFEKAEDIVSYSILTAGPAINLIVAVPLLLLMSFFFAPLSEAMTEPVGFAFDGINATMPAGVAKLTPGTVYTYYNEKNVTSVNLLIEDLQYRLAINQTITIGRYNENKSLETFFVTTTAHPADGSKPYIGVIGPHSVRETKAEYKMIEPLFLWFKELVRWLFWFNFLIGLMNLLPLYITDGGQIVKVFANRLYAHDKKKADKMYHIVCSIGLYVIILAAIVPFVFRLF